MDTNIDHFTLSLARAGNYRIGRLHHESSEFALGLLFSLLSSLVYDHYIYTVYIHIDGHLALLVLKDQLHNPALRAQVKFCINCQFCHFYKSILHLSLHNVYVL